MERSVMHARQAMNNIVQAKDTEKPCVQTSLAFSSPNSKELCKLMMTAMENKFLSEGSLPFLPPYIRDSVRMAFWSPEPDYPN